MTGGTRYIRRKVLGHFFKTAFFNLNICLDIAKLIIACANDINTIKTIWPRNYQYWGRLILVPLRSPSQILTLLLEINNNEYFIHHTLKLSIESFQQVTMFVKKYSLHYDRMIQMQ